MGIVYFRNGMTVKELKDYVKDLPEWDEDSEEPYKVYISTGNSTSSPCVVVSSLNDGDTLLGTGKV